MVSVALFCENLRRAIIELCASMNIGEHPQPRQPRIKLGPDGELEEAMPVPEIGTYRRSRLRRVAEVIFPHRETPPSPDAETLNRFLSMGLTTRPTTCTHCGTRWPAGSKQYCVTCGYPLPSKQRSPLWDELGWFYWGAVYLASIGGIFFALANFGGGKLGIDVVVLILLGCSLFTIVAQIAGGFGYGNRVNRD